jgi:hypothetical protein
MREAFAHFALALVVGLPVARPLGPAAGSPAPAPTVAAGMLEASEAVEAWVSSPGHLANLTAPGIRHVEAAHVVGRPACRGCSPDYWVLVLATTRQTDPPVPVACDPPVVATR